MHKTDLLPTGRPLCRAPLRMRFRFYSFAPIFQCRQKQKRLILLLFQTTNFSGLYELQLPLLSKFGLFFVLHHLSFHSPIADRVWKDVVRLLTLQCYNDDTILKTCQTLTTRPGAYFSKVPKVFGRISGDIILFVSSKRRRLEARNFAVLFIFIPFTTY